MTVNEFKPGKFYRFTNPTYYHVIKKVKSEFKPVEMFLAEDSQQRQSMFEDGPVFPDMWEEVTKEEWADAVAGEPELGIEG